ncbi:hypothetical protein ZIOFF_043251 [Zingiber officinale]|uniref:Uncharacterized protein n=1 Tax=Zingiber officinale TaxID=94328 RepID=A0A8J5FYV7_ZINOF|nr:hypothetical protein ZIOFF_043251 [Zingiber officinale]
MAAITRAEGKSDRFGAISGPMPTRRNPCADARQGDDRQSKEQWAEENLGGYHRGDRTMAVRLIPLGGGDDMAEGSDARAWEELIPDALGLIFRNLPLQEILTVIPRVYKSWSRVVLGPYCWQEIDIDEWSQHCKPEQLDKMLHMLIDRSCGSFRRLSVSGLHTESMFTLIADHAGSLQRLELPRSEMNDAIVKLVAPRLCNLTYLDVSYCSKIAIILLNFHSDNAKAQNFQIASFLNMSGQQENVAAPKLNERILSSLSKGSMAAHPWHDLETGKEAPLCSMCAEESAAGVVGEEVEVGGVGRVAELLGQSCTGGV